MAGQDVDPALIALIEASSTGEYFADSSLQPLEFLARQARSKSRSVETIKKKNLFLIFSVGGVAGCLLWCLLALIHVQNELKKKVASEQELTADPKVLDRVRTIKKDSLDGIKTVTNAPSMSVPRSAKLPHPTAKAFPVQTASVQVASDPAEVGSAIIKAAAQLSPETSTDWLPNELVFVGEVLRFVGDNPKTVIRNPESIQFVIRLHRTSKYEYTGIRLDKNLKDYPQTPIRCKLVVGNSNEKNKAMLTVLYHVKLDKSSEISGGASEESKMWIELEKGNNIVHGYDGKHVFNLLLIE